MSDRTNQFKIMLSDQEKAWLEELASSRGLTSSDVLRLYIRTAFFELETIGRMQRAIDSAKAEADASNRLLAGIAGDLRRQNTKRKRKPTR